MTTIDQLYQDYISMKKAGLFIGSYRNYLRYRENAEKKRNQKNLGPGKLRMQPMTPNECYKIERTDEDRINFDRLYNGDWISE